MPLLIDNCFSQDVYRQRLSLIFCLPSSFIFSSKLLKLLIMVFYFLAACPLSIQNKISYFTLERLQTDHSLIIIVHIILGRCTVTQVSMLVYYGNGPEFKSQYLQSGTCSGQNEDFQILVWGSPFCYSYFSNTLHFSASYIVSFYLNNFIGI